MTEYRIIPGDENSEYDFYLQFKHTTITRKFLIGSKTESSVWKFVPDERLYQEDFFFAKNCPDDWNYHSGLGVVGETKDNLRYLEAFSRVFPNIKTYLNNLNKKRTQMLDDEREEKLLRMLPTYPKTHDTTQPRTSDRDPRGWNIHDENYNHWW